MSAPIMEVENLSKTFPGRKSVFGKSEPKVAVDGVSLSVAKGQTLALVGESGSGKSTVGLMALGLLEPTAGLVKFYGQPLVNLKRAERLHFRRRIQVVFQDPFSSLNGRMTVREILTEGMLVHKLGRTAAERESRALQLLDSVGLRPEALDKYPHEFSGGQRQRIAIARALSVEPEFIVLDEPTSALDVSVQSQVLNLLRRLQRERGLSYLFITHNLAVVEYMADEVCVMSRGKIIEQGTVEAIFDTPREAYTKQLLSSIPGSDPDARNLTRPL